MCVQYERAPLGRSDQKYNDRCELWEASMRAWESLPSRVSSWWASRRWTLSGAETHDMMPPDRDKLCERTLTPRGRRPPVDENEILVRAISHQAKRMKS